MFNFLLKTVNIAAENLAKSVKRRYIVIYIGGNDKKTALPYVVVRFYHIKQCMRGYDP